jgi:hypothetical protein
LIFWHFRHEGRTWYSSHRGRLWIASTVKEPSKEEIQELEKFYRNHYGKEDLRFPQHYPAGCLLGCVDVLDVLPQESYRLQYPNGESESPYVFICENPHELFVKFPNKGQHKICKLHFTIYITHIYLFLYKLLLQYYQKEFAVVKLSPFLVSILLETVLNQILNRFGNSIIKYRHDNLLKTSVPLAHIY